MSKTKLHDWDIAPKVAIQLQRDLAGRVRLRPLGKRPRTVAGADIAIDRRTNFGVAAVIVFSYPGLEEVDRGVAKGKLPYPYIPGLLSFREAPLLLNAFSKLDRIPDVAVFDGQGIAHPRGLGLASHMGLWLEIPTIGCAKSRLVGDFKLPAAEAGSWSPMSYETCREKRRRVGACLRTRSGVKPVFVSPGHLIDLRNSISIVLGCCDGLRIPKPTRMADRLVGELAR